MKPSRIIQGLMRTDRVNEDELYEIIQYDLDHGIARFDLADIYGRGESERKLGAVLRNHPELREKMWIQTKATIRFGEAGGYYDSGYAYIKQAVNGSLQRLGIDALDSFLLHRPDIFLDGEEVAQAFDELYQEGKVHHFGVSNYPKEAIAYLQKHVHQKLEYNQIQFGVGHLHLVEEVFNFNVNRPGGIQRTSGTYFYLLEKGIGIQAWSPFIVGAFEGSLFDEGKYPEMNQVLQRFAEKYQTSKCAIATAFVLRLNPEITLITGSMDIRHIQECLDGENVPLSKEDWYTIYKECGHLLP